MTYQAEHIEEGLRRIFANFFQYFHIIPRCCNRSNNGESRKSPL